MKKQLVATIILVTTPFLFVSCVSSLLQEKPPTFSSDIKFSEPNGNFVKINKSVYPAWKNKQTGNVISIVSDCSENTAASLSSLHQLITESIDQAKLIKQQQLTFKQKPALLNLTEGELDGSPIEIQSMSFIRKKCGYVSSLSGKPKSLESDKKDFDNFNESLSFE